MREMAVAHVLRRLRELRKDKEMRQEHVARRLGIDRTTYARKERGGIPITTDEWLKLAEAMEEDPAVFFSADGGDDDGRDDGVNELLLSRLYRALNYDERCDFISSLRLMLKGVRRRDVKKVLDMMREP